MGSSASSQRRPSSSYPGNRGGGRGGRLNQSAPASSSAASTAAAAAAASAPPRRTRPSSQSFPATPPGTSRPGTSSYRAPNSNRTSTRPSSNGDVQTISRPGAYSVVPSNSTSNSSTPSIYRVTIPAHVRPNQEFQVYAGSRIVRVRCPPNSRPGSTVQISVPPEVEEVVEDRGDLVTPAVLTSAEGTGGGGAHQMTASTRRFNEQETQQGTLPETIDPDPITPSAPPPSRPRPPSSSASNLPPPPAPGTAYNVIVPEGVQPGQNFPVRIHNHTMQVQCPANARPGMTVRIIPPARATDLTRTPENSAPPSTAAATNPNNLSNSTSSASSSNSQEQNTFKQVFEVLVPDGVRPGNSFALMAAGQRVLVTCPPNALPGQRIRFTLPLSTPLPTSRTGQGAAGAANGSGGAAKNNKKLSKKERMQQQQRPIVEMKYDTKDGWIRTLRITDMKFTWIRVDATGNLEDESTTRLNVEKLALVRQVRFMRGNDTRMRTGIVSLAPAAQSSLDSSIRINEDEEGKNGKEVVGYAELGFVQTQKNFEEKVEWFHMICDKRLKIPWEEGHLRITVRRSHLLSDSMDAIMSLTRRELRKIWRVDFMGEEGIDAGGLIKEFFELVTQAIFDADSGLWLSASSGNQMCMRINPASDVNCPEDHLVYFRFLGRIMGKAMMEGQFVCGHMVQFLYKHMLGWPVTFQDLQSVDDELFTNLTQLLKYDAETIESLCLDFTIAQDNLGKTETIHLVENGDEVEVTSENLNEYFEAYLNHILLDKIKLQVTELLLGFYDVMPETLLTIFDYQELELVMCGLPTIDLNDWMSNTQYSGLYGEGDYKKYDSCRWFWETVRDDFDQEMKARLLQFVTGTSGVPARGFSVLQGGDGCIKKFTIHGVDYKQAVYPRAHTCFNRIDLPTYSSKKELAEKLKIAVTSCATGFTME